MDEFGIVGGEEVRFQKYYDDFIPTKEILFEDRLFPVPNHFEKLLTQYYGDYMQLPPEEERVWHNNGMTIFP